MTKAVARDSPRNQLLSSLCASDLKLLDPFLQPVELELEKILIMANKPIKHIYFPTSGVISLATASTLKRQIEVGIIGREGMTGVNLLLGEACSPHTTYVQIAGQAERIRTKDLYRALKKSATLRDDLLRFVQTLKVQMASTVLAISQAMIVERLARWLLMAHDRLAGDELPITHAHLAVILCCQRTGVTEAMNSLNGLKLIESKRGVVRIRSWTGLEVVANGIYGVPEAEYRRLFGRYPNDRR